MTIQSVYQFLVGNVCHLFIKFCGNQLSSFCVILLMNKQSEKITSWVEVIKILHSESENITSWVEVIKILHSESENITS